MHSISRFVFSLMVAVLLRGLPAAYALPMGAEHSGAPVAEAAADCHDHENPVASALHEQHDSRSCEISCDLGAAPALLQHPVVNVAQPPSVRVAVVRPLIMTDPAPPDHPPPIA